MTDTNTRILIRELPSGALATEHFEVSTAAHEPLDDRQVRCATIAIHIAAGARAGLQGSASYAGSPTSGIVMNGTGVARVLESNHPDFAADDLVVAPTGWQSHPVLNGSQLTKVPNNADPALYVTALGTNGLTAYFGLLEVGHPKAGETVLVSAAAGSVGHLVGQIAKIHDTRVVGVCGSDAKGQRLVDELGFDAVVNYKSPDFRAELKEACPDGVDVYFDNTGGDVLGAALFRMNVGGRIACCGVVSQYDTNTPAPGPKGVPGLLINKRLHMQGFLVFDFAEHYAHAQQQMQEWMDSGALHSWQDEYSGLESAPAAFVDLLAGGNLGTRIVRL